MERQVFQVFKDLKVIQAVVFQDLQALGDLRGSQGPGERPVRRVRSRWDPPERTENQDPPDLRENWGIPGLRSRCVDVLEPKGRKASWETQAFGASTDPQGPPGTAASSAPH